MKMTGAALGLAVATLGLTIGTGAALAQTPLVQVTGKSPFGALKICGNFPGELEPVGENFLDSEVEPWIDVNPQDAANLVGIWQQDRWSNGGARSNLAGASFDGGETWRTVLIPGLTACSGGSFERASDPWLSFGPDGTVYESSLVFDNDIPEGFGRSGVAVSKSSDGGLSWSDPILLIEDSDPSFSNDKESLTADPTDPRLVYAVWDRLGCLRRRLRRAGLSRPLDRRRRDLGAGAPDLRSRAQQSDARQSDRRPAGRHAARLLRRDHQLPAQRRLRILPAQPRLHSLAQRGRQLGAAAAGHRHRQAAHGGRRHPR
jgi:hypothetical protein